MGTVADNPESNKDQTLFTRARAAYLGLAIGDALGATVEFMTAREIAHSFGVHDKIIGGGWLKLKAGQVTDDTTMSLALGQAILQDKAVHAKTIASAFDAWMKAKPVDIGNTIRRGIVHFRYTGIPEVPESEHDAGNGACMRCLPIALFSYLNDCEQVIVASRAQAHITHNNAVSDAGVECVIAMIQRALAGQTKSELRNGPVASLLHAFPVYGFRSHRHENPTGYIVETLQAVFQSFFDTANFKECLIDVVNRGGDSDTTGAIAGMIAGSYYGLAALPDEWVNVLDQGIRSACESQADALIRLGLSQENSMSGTWETSNENRCT